MAAEVLAGAGRGRAPDGRHALGGPQVPAGRQGRPEPHPLRAAGALRHPLRRAPRRTGAAAAGLRARRAARLGAGPGHRHLCRQLGPRLPHRHEGRAAAARLAAPPAPPRQGPGVQFHMRHRWQGWGGDAARRTCCFDTPDGPARWQARAVVLALGGASWARLGSDGAWLPWLQARGVAVAPLQPSNCGFDVAGGWTPFFAERFAGQPFKSVAMPLHRRRGRRISPQGRIRGHRHRRRRQPDLRRLGPAARPDQRPRPAPRCTSTCCPTGRPSACAPTCTTRAAPARCPATSKAASGSTASRWRCCTKSSAKAELAQPDVLAARHQGPAPHPGRTAPHRRSHQHRRRRDAGGAGRPRHAARTARRVLRRRNARLGSPHRRLPAHRLPGHRAKGGAGGVGVGARGGVWRVSLLREVRGWGACEPPFSPGPMRPTRRLPTTQAAEHSTARIDNSYTSGYPSYIDCVCIQGENHARRRHQPTGIARAARLD